MVHRCRGGFGFVLKSLEIDIYILLCMKGFIKWNSIPEAPHEGGSLWYINILISLELKKKYKFNLRLGNQDLF